jgi:hypothetical protein
MMNEIHYFFVLMSVAYERICEYSSPLRSPVEVDGALYIVA